MNKFKLLPIVILSFSSYAVYASTNQYYGESNNLKPSMENRDEKNQMDAIDIILKDHEHIRDILAKLDKALNDNSQDRQAQFKKLKDFASKHEKMEQDIWYPALEKEHADLKKIIAHLKEEEKEAGDMLKKLDDKKEDKEWISKVRKLVEGIKQHAADEESKLFPKVREMVDKQKLMEIGKKLKEYHEKNDMKY